MIDSNRIEPVERARPARMCLSLMDRWEIGGPVVLDLFLPIIQSIKTYQDLAPSPEHYQEVMRSGTMFFDGVEAHLIWGVIHECIDSAVTRLQNNVKESMDKFELVNFILRTFNIREEEMVVVHAPLVTLALLVMLRELAKKSNTELLEHGFGLVESLLDLIPQRAFHAAKPRENGLGVRAEDILPAVNKYYSRQSIRLNTSIPFSMKLVGKQLIYEISEVVCETISSQQDSSGIRYRLMVQALRKVPKDDIGDHSSLTRAISGALSSNTIRFSTLQGSAQIIASLYNSECVDQISMSGLVFPIVEKLWSFLSPDTPKYHVEAVKTLWALQDVLKDRRVEAAIATFMTKSDVRGVYETRPAESGRRFSVLWTHSVGNAKYEVMLTRPLLLFLDSLAEEGTELYIYSRGWLQNLQTTTK